MGETHHLAVYGNMQFDNTEIAMLYYAAVFFLIAIVAAIFGFGGIAAGAAGIAKVLFFIFVVIFIISLVMGLGNKKRRF